VFAREGSWCMYWSSTPCRMSLQTLASIYVTTFWPTTKRPVVAVLMNWKHSVLLLRIMNLLFWSTTVVLPARWIEAGQLGLRKRCCQTSLLLHLVGQSFVCIMLQPQLLMLHRTFGLNYMLHNHVSAYEELLSSWRYDVMGCRLCLLNRVAET